MSPAARPPPATPTDRLTIVPGTPLPKGWTGKLWAMRQGIAAAMASETPPDYLLLTDADIVYAAACAELACRPRLRQEPRARLVHGVAALRDGGGTRAHSGLHLFLPDVVSVLEGQPAGRRDGRCRRRMHAGAGRGAPTGGRDRCDPQRPDRRLRARRPSQGQGADLARPDVAGAQPARISALVGRRAHGVADGLCAAALFACCCSPGPSPASRSSISCRRPRRCSAPGSTRGFGIAAWAIMALAVPADACGSTACRRWWGFALPAIAAAYLVFTVQSAIASIRGKGGLWKGRFQAAGAK